MIVITDAGPVTEEFLHVTYDYEFRTYTGCRLAGSADASRMGQRGMFTAMPPGVGLLIRCTQE
jgi:hypothetical protein